MPTYAKPQNRIHRGFFYLDDETVINSLSAVESGKIDEIVAKVVSAREGGFGVSIGLEAGVASGKVDGRRAKNASLEEEIVRTRTRFSAFEAWYKWLLDGKGLGRFSGWDESVLTDVTPGDTVEFVAELQLVPLETLARLYLWFADQAATQGSMFGQKGPELQTTKNTARVMRQILGGAEDATTAALLVATVSGGHGPSVALSVKSEWLVGRLGEVAGKYTVVAQIEQVLQEGDEWPALRLTRDVSPTPLEISTLREVVGHFIEPAKGLGVEVPATASVVTGPALIVKPIAIYR